MKKIYTLELLLTEKRLIRLFIIGIFLFLIIFEVVFLMSRYFLEQYTQREQFRNMTDETTQNMIERNPPPLLNSRKRPGNIGFLVIGENGNVITSRIAGQEVTNVNDIITLDTINNLPLGDIHKKEGLLLRKITQKKTGATLLFLAPINYDMEGLFRDFLRFLLLDLIILIPFWYMARTYVRETLEPVQKNIDTMTHFVHDAGHELKTPLAILSGTLQLLRDSKKPDMTLIEEGLGTIDTMNTSIEGLLELADLRSANTSEVLYIGAEIKSILQGLEGERAKKDIQIDTEIGESVQIIISKSHFDILMKNIIENAIKYNKEQGNIKISCKNKTIIVQDSGIGIDPEDKKRIFDRFYRGHHETTHKGSGIGLTLVERITTLYGWSIEVESEAGEGTTVRINHT